MFLSMEKAFRHIDVIVELMTYFPPLDHCGRAVTEAQWKKNTKGEQLVYPAEICEIKYNLLPKSYHGRFDSLEKD